MRAGQQGEAAVINTTQQTRPPAEEIIHDPIPWAVCMSTRLHRRFLGPLWPVPAAEGGKIFENISLSPLAIRSLHHLMSAPGRWRAGPLFGHVADDTLQIHVAAPGSDRHSLYGVLEGNAAYQLGWADALHGLGLTHLDWVGTWLMSPNNLLPSYTDAEFWLHQGAKTSLFDDQTVLLACGLQEQRHEFDAYRLIDDRVIVIPTQH